MGVQRPSWWCYPLECANGHEWGPGRIILSWMPCDCPPARAAREHGPGHMVVYCDAAPGCRSVVPAAARPGRVIHGPLRPPILDGLAAFVADALPAHWGSPG